MDAPVRRELADEFSQWLYRLQFNGDGYREGKVFALTGIIYVPNPYGSGQT